jgi:hypothetical protein
MWRAKELLLRPTLAYKNAVGETCSGVACLYEAVPASACATPVPSVAPSAASVEGDGIKGSTGPESETSAGDNPEGSSTSATVAAVPVDIYAHIHSELCPHHSELASVLSYRLPRRKCSAYFRIYISFSAKITYTWISQQRALGGQAFTMCGC